SPLCTSSRHTPSFGALPTQTDRGLQPCAIPTLSTQGQGAPSSRAWPSHGQELLVRLVSSRHSFVVYATRGGSVSSGKLTLTPLACSCAANSRIRRRSKSFSSACSSGYEA